MSENARPFCPECETPEESLDRRHFIRVLGEQTPGALALAAVAGAAQHLPAAETAAPAKKPEKPAETLVKELFAGLSADQKQAVVFDFKDKRRLGMYNGPIAAPIGKTYTKAQQELIDRIVRAIAADED